MSEATNDARPSAHALLWRARDVLLEKPAWLDYVRQVYSVDPGGYPFLSYLGVNFTQGSIKNYKLYFSFFKRLSSGEVDALLPVKDRGRFDEVYGWWHPSHQYRALHRGTTFALKIDADGTLTHYYHLRFPGLRLGLPERLDLRPVDHANHHGVCEEFTGSKVHLKKYWYVTDPETIAESLRTAGLSDDTAQIPLLEYIESDGRDKYAWITEDQGLIGELLDARGQPRLASGLRKLCHETGFMLFGPGSAKDRSDHSIYFVEPGLPGPQGGYLFDGVRTFITRFLKLPATLEP